jgi:hypothetical protein
MSNWPTRYRCRKCSRSTSSYPFGCPEENCPVKRDVINDVKFDFYIGTPLYFVFLIGCMFAVYLFFDFFGSR